MTDETAETGTCPSCGAAYVILRNERPGTGFGHRWDHAGVFTKRTIVKLNQRVLHECSYEYPPDKTPPAPPDRKRL